MNLEKIKNRENTLIVIEDTIDNLLLNFKNKYNRKNDKISIVKSIDKNKNRIVYLLSYDKKYLEIIGKIDLNYI